MTGDRSRVAARMTMPLLAVVMAVAGCAREEPYTAPLFAFLPSFAGGQPRQADSVPVLVQNSAWWQSFHDPVLNGLVDRALTGNLDLTLARERVDEARAGLGSAPQNLSLDPSARAARRVDSDGPNTTSRSATLDFSWLIDPYGARFHQLRANRARLEAAEAELDAARLLMLLNVANDYIELRFQERVLQIRSQEAAARRQTLELTNTLFERGSATRLEVLAAEARLAETQATIPNVRAAIERQKYRLAVLLGQSPGTVPVGGGTGQLHPRMAPETGIPADLLRNRPDIQVAERDYYAAVAETGVARADLYPKLSLGGALSLSSVGDGTARSAVFGPSLTLPSLPGDTRRAAVQVRESRAEQAHVVWRSTVLEAILEVETALLEYAASTRSVTAADRSVRLYRETVGLTRELVLRDGATIRELLDAEESVADAELTLARALRDRAQSFVRLNVSLGAGNGYGGGPDIAVAN